MKKYYFNYLKNFRCTAGNCKHSCCKGWQICIDKKSLLKYKLLGENNPLFDGKIDYENSRFHQDNLGVCAFLDKDGLCLLIKEQGEKALCATCKTHPRFKNYFNGFCEIGAGLTCEEIARIVLSSKRKMKLLGVKNLIKENPSLTDFQKSILRFRNKAIKIVQNRKLNISQRIDACLNMCSVDVYSKTLKGWFNFINTLEKLDSNSQTIFNQVENSSLSFESLNLNQKELEIQFEQILSYFIYRHIARAIDVVDLNLQLAFCILSFLCCVALFRNVQKNGLSGDTCSLIECCRVYSSEIEYSQNNLDAILVELENYIKLC